MPEQTLFLSFFLSLYGHDTVPWPFELLQEVEVYHSKFIFVFSLSSKKKQEVLKEKFMERMEIDLKQYMLLISRVHYNLAKHTLSLSLSFSLSLIHTRT